MTNYRPPSIREVGLQKHLERSGHDYDLFVQLYNSGMSKSAMARRFGVIRLTIDKWIKIYELELKGKG